MIIWSGAVLPAGFLVYLSMLVPYQALDGGAYEQWAATLGLVCGAVVLVVSDYVLNVIAVLCEEFLPDSKFMEFVFGCLGVVGLDFSSAPGFFFIPLRFFAAISLVGAVVAPFVH